MAPYEISDRDRSSTTSTRSTTNNLASVTRDKLSDVMSTLNKPETRSGIKDGWDTLVKAMFAPCAGQMGGEVGGIPREEIYGMDGNNNSNKTPPRSKGFGTSQAVTPPPPAWGASVPFEVSGSQIGASLISGVLPPQTTQTQGDLNASGISNNSPSRNSNTPRAQREAKSRQKLRQLGAQHQLRAGFPGESLADTARPISPNEQTAAAALNTSLESAATSGTAESTPLIDFDDGISAISSHTLEEMERRRQVKDKKHIVRLNPQDFSQIISASDEIKYTSHDNSVLNNNHTTLMAVKEVDEKDTEVVFGEPFYQATPEDVNNKLNTIEPAPKLNRVTSTRTHQTNNTEDSFEEYKRHEAMYWVDQDQVADTEGRQRQTRPSQRMGIEERARRLRELSRSRSRSDGTGSSNKSATSSLVSGHHPHDTAPVYSSALLAQQRQTKSSRGSRRTPPRPQQNGFVPGSKLTGDDGSDPFADFGEI